MHIWFEFTDMRNQSTPDHSTKRSTEQQWTTIPESFLFTLYKRRQNPKQTAPHLYKTHTHYSTPLHTSSVSGVREIMNEIPHRIFFCWFWNKCGGKLMWKEAANKPSSYEVIIYICNWMMCEMRVSHLEPPAHSKEQEEEESTEWILSFAGSELKKNWPPPASSHTRFPFGFGLPLNHDRHRALVCRQSTSTQSVQHSVSV